MPEELGEAPVVGGEGLRSSRACRRFDRRVLADAAQRVVLVPPHADAEERRDPRYDSRWVGEQLLARDEEELVMREQLEPALDLVEVAATRDVGAREQERRGRLWIRRDPFQLKPELALLALERLLERQRLAAPAEFHLVDASTHDRRGRGGQRSASSPG